MDEVFVVEPLALEYLAAGAKLDGHEVEILDARLEPDYERAFTRMVPDLVGITGYTSHVPAMRDITARLKACRPETVVLVGGIHASSQPEDFNKPWIDFIAIGEGVLTLRELAQRLEKQEPVEGVRGLAIPGPELRFTEPRAYTELNELPFPDRSLTAPHRQSYFYEWHRPVALVRTSVGCKGRCNFCCIWQMTGGKYLRRDPEQIVAELKTIQEPYVHFCDDETMLDAERMDLLADMIIREKIRKKYITYARTDTIVRHPELFAKWRKIGLKTVLVGMESFSDGRLRAMKKSITMEQHAAAVQLLKQMDIFLYASFMVDPAFTADDFRALAAYIKSMKLRYASFTIMTPLPGSELYREKRSELTTERFELFDLFHALLPTTLPLPEFYRQFAELYMHTVSLYDGLSTLLRYGWSRIPAQLRLGNKFIAQIHKAHLDHPGWAATEEKI